MSDEATVDGQQDNDFGIQRIDGAYDDPEIRGMRMERSPSFSKSPVTTSRAP
ncbi:uncharacterized protein DNG_08636 [Cephalotrichum gorgonifer]|uniref:Uncharacterized protein n=1 Tax=Cephalotrichum gorgonifer TaxID=2041049 RepID=A0AAE8N4M9_9PEZI|nr:uncharacterized protein DNG_08636 [Cephalotrichum gorgonifer]